MKREEYRKQLEGDAEYQAAAKELKPILDIADEILRLRLERGWTQSELARRVGTRQANISRIEAGLGNPTIKFIQKLATAFECDLELRFEKPRPLADIKSHFAVFVKDWFQKLNSDAKFTQCLLSQTNSSQEIDQVKSSLAQEFFSGMKCQITTASDGTGGLIDDPDADDWIKRAEREALAHRENT